MSGRSIRIGNMSGFYGDRPAAMREMLTGGQVDYLTGDYLAELTMLILGRDRLKDPGAGYAKTFLRALRENLELALDHGVKIVVNAGGLNPAGLAGRVRDLAEELGREVKVGYVDGDDLIARAAEIGAPGAITANAYLGGFGIAECLRAGAQIVITGRVTDASTITGPCIAEFGWGRGDYDALAGATVAGHVIECGTQATGGNYAFFTEIPIEAMLRPGFPIAEVAADGRSVITKHVGTGGIVTPDTVTAQLLYEVTGARYAGPDVTSRLDTAVLTSAGPDRVAIRGVIGEPPSPTTKVAATALGGYRNEMSWLLTGLDIDAKAALVRRQLEAELDPAPAELEFRLARTDHPDADTEAAASAILTVVAWDSDPTVVGRNFSGAAVALALASYPGATLTGPPGNGGPYGVYTPCFVPNEQVPHRAHLPNGQIVDIAPPPVTAPLGPNESPSPAAGAPGIIAGEPTVRVPLGTIFGARSGDKGGSANIGIWARTPEAFAWLREYLTTARLTELLPETAELPVGRYELANLRAINFVIEDILGKGVAHGYRFDPQGKGLGEWLRARHVDLPARLLEGRSA